MYNYHCQIAGLPELTFSYDNLDLGVKDFVSEIRPYLLDKHIEWFDMLLYSQTHKAVINYFSTGVFEDGLAPFFKQGWFNSEAGESHLLPAYLQRLNNMVLSRQGEFNSLEMEKLLYQEYYHYLKQSGNGFINNWATLDMNLRNYLTAKECEEFEFPKHNQVVKGGEFADRLLELPVRHKEIKAEWELSEIINSFFDIKNLAEREMAVDRLRWSLIDELNQFRYFTIEIILGYLLKLMIIERWKELELPAGPNLVEEISENIVQGHLTENPIIISG
ncbi:hypothetical protein MNBD_BACTEROID01-723 [hydrothermal vent metagenome]|uniref:V-type ATP synthase subunit C n=1 Tax=hydrothermal vent metagenome TaxID=652676 RepID=A0A3B0TG92_9ZZZZ